RRYSSSSSTIRIWARRNDASSAGGRRGARRIVAACHLTSKTGAGGSRPRDGRRLKRPGTGTDTRSMGAAHAPRAGIPDPSGVGSGGAAPVGTVLVVDDEPLMLRAMARILRGDAWRVVLAETADAAREALADPALDVVLLDLRLGAESGLDLLERIKEQRPEVEVVVMTGHATIESAVGCMREGAFDYLEKPFDDVHRVRNTVRKAIERRRLLARNRELEARLEDRERLPELIGHSAPMRRLARTIASLRHN